MFPSLFGCSFSSSRLFSGSRVVSRKKPATIRQQQQQPTARATNSQQPVAIRAAGVAKRVDPAAHAFRHAARAVQTPLPISLRRSPITSTLLVEYSNLGVRTPGFPKIAQLSSEIAVFSGKCTFTRGLRGFGGSGGGPWGEGWGHMGEGSAALGDLGFRCASHPC